MKSPMLRKFIGALALAVFCLTAAESWATLPKPIQIHAVVVFMDHETQTVVVKPSQPTKEPKPFVLDWNKDTRFIKDGEMVTATDLKHGASAVIHYKRVSFRNPLLKKVIWETTPKKEGQQP
jgi:hypothetical protein